MSDTTDGGPKTGFPFTAGFGGITNQVTHSVIITSAEYLSLKAELETLKVRLQALEHAQDMTNHHSDTVPGGGNGVSNSSFRKVGNDSPEGVNGESNVAADLDAIHPYGGECRCPHFDAGWCYHERGAKWGRVGLFMRDCPLAAISTKAPGDGADEREVTTTRDEVIQQINKNLPPGLNEFIEWMDEDYLPDEVIDEVIDEVDELIGNILVAIGWDEESVDTTTAPLNPDNGQNSDTYPELSPNGQNSDTSPKHDAEGDTSATS